MRTPTWSICVLIIALLPTRSASAQKFIDLSERALDPDVPALVVDSVISAIGDSACIGTVIAGMESLPVNVFLDRPISAALKDLCARGRPAEGEHVWLKVNRLRVIGTRCALHLEVIRPQGDSIARLFAYGQTRDRWEGATTNGTSRMTVGSDRVTVRMGMGVKAQSACIAMMVSDALRTAVTTMASGRPLGMEPADRLRSISRAPQLSTGTTSPLAVGVYHRYSDLVLDTPDGSLNLETVLGECGTHGLRCLKIKGEDRSIARQAWGYCDGQRRYVRVLNLFFELKEKTNGYYTYLVPMPEPGEMDDVMMWGAMFGLTGALIASAGSSPVAPARFELDAYTGELVRTHACSSTEPMGTEQIISYSRFSKESGSIALSIGDHALGTLLRGQYMKVKLAPQPSPAAVRLMTSDWRTSTIWANTNAPVVQVHLVKLKDDGINVDLAKPTMVPELLEKLKPENAVRALDVEVP